MSVGPVVVEAVNCSNHFSARGAGYDAVQVQWAQQKGDRRGQVS